MNVAIFFSGRGLNLESIIKRSLKEDSKFSVKLAITDYPGAEGIYRAHQLGTPVNVIPKNNGIYIAMDVLNLLEIDLVVLAGFMKIMPPYFCNKWYGRCINIHPSLLPLYKGLGTHQKVFNNKDTTHGCTVHYVSTGLDSGPIIAQETINIDQQDTVESIAANVLSKEVQLFPAVIQAISGNRIVLNKNDKVIFDEKYISSPLTLENLL